jgi:hypothetical protein
MVLVPFVTWGKSCKEKIRDLTNPFARAVNLREAERNQLTGQAMRFFEPLRAMKDIFEAFNPNPDMETVLKRVKAEDLRKWAFYFEADMMTSSEEFEDTSYKKLLKQAFKKANDLRFVTGNFTDALDNDGDLIAIRANAKKLKVKPNISKIFEEELDREVLQGRLDYADFLVKNEWVGKNPESLKLMEKAATVLGSMSEEEDLKMMKKNIIDYIKETKSKEFDMDDLEGGIHPLRRHLRWISFMFQTLNIFALYHPDSTNVAIAGKPYLPNPDFPGEPLDPAAQRYATLKNTGTTLKPIYIYKNVYEYLTLLISELGKAKEVGQRIDRFAHIYRKSGLARNEKEAYAMAEKLASLHPLYMDYRQHAHDLQDGLEKSGLLDELILEVQKGIDARLAELRSIP